MREVWSPRGYCQAFQTAVRTGGVAGQAIALIRRTEMNFFHRILGGRGSVNDQIVIPSPDRLIGGGDSHPAARGWGTQSGGEISDGRARVGHLPASGRIHNSATIITFEYALLHHQQPPQQPGNKKPYTQCERKSPKISRKNFLTRQWKTSAS